MNESLVCRLLQECWEEFPHARHKSLVTSILIRETFGGEIRTSCDDRSLYLNRIVGTDYAFSTSPGSNRAGELIELPRLIERVPGVNEELLALQARWRRTLRTRLPLPSISHVVIQDEEANAGSYANPDFSCVLVTANSVEHLNASLFFPGQTFWLKRAAGPIIAMATLDRWIVGSLRDWSSRDLLHATSGFPIAHHSEFWERIAGEPAQLFLLVFLEDVCSLDVPLYPFEAAHGRRVVPLSDHASHIAWLYSDGCTLNLPPPIEHRPTSLPYQFRWESLLSPEVSIRLSERTPRNGRFRERIAVLNGALLEYFTFLEQLSEDEVVGLFSDDQLCLLAELNEAHDGGPDRTEFLADLLLELGLASVYSASTRIETAEMVSLSETLRELTHEQSLVLLDALRKRTAMCPARVRRAWLHELESDEAEA